VLIGSMRLPLENVSGGDYSTLLAVKADHFYNRRLIPDKSIWRTGHPQMPEVDTSDPKQLASWNAFLDLQHQKRINQLELAGIVVAPVVYQPQLRPYKIDVIATDNSLSRGFEQIGKKL